MAEPESDQEMRERVIKLVFGGDESKYQSFLDVLQADLPVNTGAVIRGSAFPAHWDPKLRIPRGQVVAAASIVSPKY